MKTLYLITTQRVFYDTAHTCTHYYVLHVYAIECKVPTEKKKRIQIKFSKNLAISLTFTFDPKKFVPEFPSRGTGAI